jgi:hypothetical protein
LLVHRGSAGACGVMPKAESVPCHRN